MSSVLEIMRKSLLALWLLAAVAPVQPAAAATSAELRPLPGSPWVTSAVGAAGLEGEMAVADFDGDRHADVAFTHASTNSVHVLRGPALRAAPELVLPAPPTSTHVSAADVTGDGRADLIVGNSQQIQVITGLREVTTALADAGCSFGGLEVVAAAGKRARNVVVGYGCGVPQDRVRDLRVYGVSPSGEIALEQQLPGGGALRLAAVDLDADGADDVVALRGGRAWVAKSLPTGFVRGSSTRHGGRGAARDLAAGDVNGDGHEDVVVLGTGMNAPKTWSGSPSPYAGLAFLRGTGRGGLRTPRNHVTVGDEVYRIAVGDLDGNRRAEVIAPSLDGTSAGVIVGGRRGLSHRVGELTGGHPEVADLNGDGRPDAITLDHLDQFGPASVVRAWHAARVPAGVAELLAPRRCVRRGRLMLRVRGRRIRSVDFRLGGKPVSPEVTRNGVRRASVGLWRVPRRGARVTATVGFATFQAPVTLSSWVRRCA